MSRNLGTIHVGEAIGFDKVAALWRRVGVGTPPKGFPSITLGVFELTPLEVAQAYTLFLNGGSVRPLRAIDHIDAGARTLQPPASRAQTCRAPRDDVPRHQHDAQRHRRGHRRRRARQRVRARRRRQERHDQRPARRLVRRLHAGAADGGLGRLRRQPAARSERHAGGAADLDRVHEDRRSPDAATSSSSRPPKASPSRRSTATPASSPRRAARAPSPSRSSPAPNPPSSVRCTRSEWFARGRGGSRARRVFSAEVGRGAEKRGGIRAPHSREPLTVACAFPTR